MVLFILGFMLLLVATILRDVGQVLVVTAGCFFLNLSFCFGSHKVERRYWVFKITQWFFLFQSFAFFLLVLAFPFLTKEMCINTTLFSGGAHSLFWSFSLLPLITFVFSNIVVCFCGQQRSPLDFQNLASDTKFDKLLFLLFVGAVITHMVWYIGLFPQRVGYGLRVINTCFSMSPLIAGLYWRRSRGLNLLWLAVLAIGIVLAVLTGNRGYAFFPLFYYGIGFFIQAKGKRKVFWVSVALLVSPILLFLLGFIQNLRDDVGRRSLGAFKIAEVLEAVPRVFNETLIRGKGDFEGDETTTTYDGMQRLVDWTLVFAPNMSPDIIPYRGYHDFNNEVRGMFVFGGANLRSVAGRGYGSVLFAQNYGFRVHLTVNESGGLSSYTVPFGVVADSWSRFGMLSSTLQIFLLLLFFFVLERSTYKIFHNDPSSFILVFSLLIFYAWGYCTTYTLTSTIRRTLVFWTFMIFFCKGLNAFVYPLFSNERSKRTNFRIAGSSRSYLVR